MTRLLFPGARLRRARSSVGILMVCVAACSASQDRELKTDEDAAQDITASGQSHPKSLWTRQQGSDWPSFLGPARNGKSIEQGIRTDWTSGLPIVWHRRLGSGFGIGTVSRGRLFQFDRYGDVARLICMHAETGNTLWEFGYETDYSDMYGYNGGPRCSPVVDGDRVYIYGAEGLLHCLRVADGKLVWKCDTVERFGVIQNFFGIGSTPIVEGDLLITIVGGSPETDQSIPLGQLDRVSGNGSGIVAFDKFTGEVRYQITDELAGYASPITATMLDRRWCFAFCRGGLVAFEPRTGAVDFEVPWRARKLESVNASTPVVVDRQVFFSETYGPGSSLIEVQSQGYDVIWQDEPRSRRKIFQAHWSTPIYHEGHLYGCSGRNSPDAEMRCLEWATGKIQWSADDGEHSSLLYVDGHFVCLEEYGRLRLIKADPKRREVVGEFDLSSYDPRSGSSDSARSSQRLLKHPCWAAPILAHGLLYVRGRDRLVCLELIPETVPAVHGSDQDTPDPDAQ